MKESVTFVRLDDLVEKLKELDGFGYVRLSIIYDDNSDVLDGAVKLGGFNDISDNEPVKFCTPVYSPDLSYLHR